MRVINCPVMATDSCVRRISKGACGGRRYDTVVISVLLFCSDVFEMLLADVNTMWDIASIMRPGALGSRDYVGLMAHAWHG